MGHRGQQALINHIGIVQLQWLNGLQAGWKAYKLDTIISQLNEWLYKQTDNVKCTILHLPAYQQAIPAYYIVYRLHLTLHVKAIDQSDRWPLGY